MYEFHSSIIFWRKQLGLSQSDLAWLVDRSRAQIQRYEQLEAIPDLETAFAIASALKRDPWHLFADVRAIAERRVAARRLRGRDL